MTQTDTTKTIEVTINGEARTITAGQNLVELLTDLGLHPQLIVVEHNREILERDQYAEVEVREGDTLELVHFVGGG